MSDTGQGRHSALRKIPITCRTCGLSDSFYSNLSVERFKSQHRGHDLVVGTEGEALAKAPSFEPAVKEAKPAEGEAGTRVEKVIVDLVTFPTLRDSVFRVRAYNAKMEEAFVVTARFENRKGMVDMLEGGEYFDRSFSGLRYVWEPGSIEYQGEAKEKLAPPVAEPSEAPTAQAEPTPVLDESSVAMTNEALFGSRTVPDIDESNQDRVADQFSVPEAPQEPARQELDDANDDRVAAQSFPLEVAPEPVMPEFDEAKYDRLVEQVSVPEVIPESGAPAPPAEVAQEDTVRVLEEVASHVPPPVMIEVKSPTPETLSPPPKRKKRRGVREALPSSPSPPKPEVEARAKSAPEVSAAQTTKRPEPSEDHLLVSKSWYIQGGKENREEAVRISNLLSGFRLKVEPAYTIGVILDDILSVESSKNEIGRELVECVEAAGYTLTAITLDHGKPVAWFKRTASEISSTEHPM